MRQHRPILWGLSAVAWSAAHALAADPDAAAVLTATGVQAGLAAHVGATDGALEVGLAKGGKFLVHGLATGGAARDAARSAIQAAGLYGLASVEKSADPAHLPYSDNQVNLLVADLDALGAKAPADAEINRVLVPVTGAAYVKKGGSWQKLAAKPMPAGYDEWTHYWYNASCAGASNDAWAGPTNSLKWIAGDSRILPVGHTGSPNRNASNTGYRVSGGRAIYGVESSPEVYGFGTNHPPDLMARDAFNGIALYKQPNFMADFGDNNTAKQMIVSGDRIYALPKLGGYMVCMNAADGSLIRTYDQGLKVPSPDPFKNYLNGRWSALLLSGNRLVQLLDSDMVALDAGTGAVLWRYHSPDGRLFYPVAAEDKNAVFAAVYDSAIYDGRWSYVRGMRYVLCYGMDTKSVRWKLPFTHDLTQMAYKNGLLALYNAEAIGGDSPESPNWADTLRQGYLGVVKADDGSWVWHLTGHKVDKHDTLPPYDGLSMILWQDKFVYTNGVYDLASGQLQGKPNVGYNGRCNRMTGSASYFAIAQVSYYDNQLTHNYSGIGRSQCATGATPAYGMWYFTPTGCACIFNQLDGFMALSHSNTPVTPIADDKRLESGDAYLAKAGAAAAAQAVRAFTGVGPIVDDWKSSNWKFAADSLTPPVNDGARMYVAVIREHRLEARANGAVAWSFTAGGRIVTAPVLSGGKLYFGSCDGWVYCLNAADGKLQWRYMAAPVEKKVVAYGQLESAWPVYGVTLYGGTHLAFSAGRHSETDGGLWVYSVDAATGKLDWKVQATIQSYPKGTNLYQYPIPSNDTLSWTGTALKLPGLTIDPANPKGFGLGTQVTTRLAEPRLNPNRPTRAVTPELPLAWRWTGTGLAVEAPAPGAQELEVRAPNGALLARRAGEGPMLYTFPAAGFAPGTYAVTLRQGGRSRSLAVTAGR